MVSLISAPFGPREVLREQIDNFLATPEVSYEKKVRTHVDVARQVGKRTGLVENMVDVVNAARYEEYGELCETVFAATEWDVWKALRQLENAVRPENRRVTFEERAAIIEEYLEVLICDDKNEGHAADIRRKKYLAGEIEIDELTDADRQWFVEQAADNDHQAEMFESMAAAAKVAAQRARAAAEGVVAPRED